jgi:hypothetical protein
MSNEEELLKAFHRFQNALLSNDVEQLDGLLAPDYRGFSLRGELESRELVLEAWKPGGISMDESSYRELRAEVRGPVGIVTGYGYVAGTFQEHCWEHHVHFCDLYLHSKDGWQVFLAHAVEVEPPK